MNPTHPDLLPELASLLHAQNNPVVLFIDGGGGGIFITSAQSAVYIYTGSLQKSAMLLIP